MKKCFYTILSVLSIALMFASCNNGVEDYELTFNETPAAVAASGEYNGLWTRILAATGDTIRDVQGKIVFGVDTVSIELDSAETATNYLASIHFVCEELGLDVQVDATNIAYSNDGFVFFNNNASNGLKRVFAGRIYDDGSIYFAFPWTQKISGRIRKFEYSFSGARVRTGK